MTVVYPLKKQTDYTELKYSLRSIDLFLKKPFEVVIVGEKMPTWIKNVTQIWVPDIPGKKQLTIKYKTLAALEYAKHILQMNDDVYLLKPQNEFPYYFHGELNSVGESGAKTLAGQLKKMGKPEKNFDGHYPIVYDERFKQVFENFRDDVVVKSAFCNYLEIEGSFIPDNKIITPQKPDFIRSFIKDRPSFSTGSHSLESCKAILNELFPEKSTYEY